MFNKDRVLEIAEGWMNVIKTDSPAIKEMAKHRTDVCLGCEFIRDSTLTKIKCGKCGCPIIAKARSPRSKCPLNKWEV